MFRGLRDRFRPKQMDDQLFGRLLFMKMRDPARSYWEGAGRFASAEHTVEYAIDADEAGPGESQRSLFRRMEAHYAELQILITPLLLREYEAWFQTSLDQDVWTVFRLSHISIPFAESQDMEWDITFDCVADEEHIFVVYMTGWEPTGQVSIDG